MARDAEILVDKIRTIGSARIGRKVASLADDEARELRRLITEIYGE